MPRQTLYKSPHLQTEKWPPERPQPGLLSEESSIDVYREGCAVIGAALEQVGFKYAKSKQRCRREKDGFGCEVAFQSSHYNVSGRHVQLWMHATVSSPKLQKWRAERLPPELASEHVAGGMVHLLGNKFALVQWELADPADREKTILDSIAFIHDEVLPYFAQFADPKALIMSLAEASIPAFDLVPSVEFAYCFGSEAHAQAVLNRFVRDRPDLHEAIASEQANPAASALLRPSGYAQQVVFLRSRHQLV